MTQKELKRLFKEIEKTDQKFNKLAQETIRKAVIKVKQSFNKIKRDVIKNWYMDYGFNLKVTPGGYYRKLDLFKIPKITVDKETGEFYYQFDPDFMNNWHRVSNEYIYQNSFVEGWHGGADKLNPGDHGLYNEPHPDGPNGGNPYWRKPSPQKGEKFIYGVHYIHWFDSQAARSFSPRDIIEEEFREQVQVIKKETQKKFDDGDKKILGDLKSYIKGYYRG